MSAKPAFSISDLQSGAKRLNTVDAPSESKNAEAKPVFDRAALEPLEDLYDKHNGDLDLIFAELNANPAKAKKPHHRPPNAKVFAEKYQVFWLRLQIKPTCYNYVIVLIQPKLYMYSDEYAYSISYYISILLLTF
jgi:hypothetical protein